MSAALTFIALAAEKAGEPNSPATQILIAALGAGGLGAILAAIVTGLFSKRKLGAEATEIITKAAAGVVTNLEGEIARITAKADRERQELEDTVANLNEKMRRIVDDHAREREEVRRVLQLHVAWDAIAIAKMAEFGVDLPPAPPLLPATIYPHDDVEG